MSAFKICFWVCVALVPSLWISDIYGNDLLSLVLSACGATLAAVCLLMLIEKGEGR